MDCGSNLDIVISGISGRFPDSENLDEFWENLIQGKDMIRENFDRYNVEEFEMPRRIGVVKNLDKFDAEYFGVHEKSAISLDTRTRFLLELTYEAIVDAGISPTTLRGTRTGVFVAAAASDGAAIWTRSYTKQNLYGATGTANSMIANRISYSFDFHGPSYVVDSACSASSVAIQLAFNAIQNGQCDSAIVAGATMFHDPNTSYYFHQLKMTSKDGKCKVFDAAADGYARAEAAVALYICKKGVAKRICATIVNVETNNDGYTEEGITYPSTAAQEMVMREVYKNCGVNPLEVDYIEAHGTGTTVGDPVEMAAISNVFCEGRNGPLLVGSVKSNMGHSEPTSGLCGIAKMILSHAHGIIPANLHYNSPNPKMPYLLNGKIQVVDKPLDFNAKFVGLSSMGFGGTNVHLLLKFAPKEKVDVWAPPIPVILPCAGRTEEAVQSFLDKALLHKGNRGFVGLAHEAFKVADPKLRFRGYAVAALGETIINIEGYASKRANWFIFTGLGSQWAGMCRDLIKFSAFEKTILKAAHTFFKHGYSLMEILQSEDAETFQDLKNALVSITTVQVALVDLLGSIDIIPDGIIGHSTGECAAGYADGSCTLEQTLVVALRRAQAFCESNLPPGTLASVGLTWEDARKRCPEGVYPAIHTAKENVTVAGTPEAVDAFVEQLGKEGIFAKRVRSAIYGFHSPLVAGCGEMMRKFVEDIIPEPKPRSPKWLSSSVPEDKWKTELAKYLSAEYHVNNCLQPVHFYTTLLHVPEDTVVWEIGPHCFFQSILKQTLPKKAVTLGLIHVKSPDNSLFFLDSIGKSYLAGVGINFAKLYDPVEFPVSAATPNIGSMIRWDHSASYDVPHHKMESSRQRGIKCSFLLSVESDSFLEGHAIDGKIVFPATGYMFLAWKYFSEANGKHLENHPVVFENVRFERMTFMTKRNTTEFLLNMFPASGRFEITESGVGVCSGFVRNVNESASAEMLSTELREEIDVTGAFMNGEDFYKEFHLRGYGHSGKFQGVHQAGLNGKWAKVKWLGEWISFLDALLQANALSNESRGFQVPLRLQKLTIDPKVVKSNLNANDEIITVKCWETLQLVTCPGLELRGLSLATLSQRSLQMVPVTTKQEFLPFLQQPNSVLHELEALEASLEICVENSFGPKFIFTEALTHLKNIISPLVASQCSLEFSALELCVVNLSGERIDNDALESISPSKVITLSEAQSRENSHLIFVDDEQNVTDLLGTLVPGGFVLYKGPKYDPATFSHLLLISDKPFLQEDSARMSFTLFRKPVEKPKRVEIIATDCNGFTWVEAAKTVLKEVEFDRVYFVSECPTSGIVGFVKCLLLELTAHRVRCFHAITPVDLDFEHPSEALRLQVEKDLVFNVHNHNDWGTLTNLTIASENFWKQKPATFAYVDALTLGDLSSLSWIESPLMLVEKELINVHFASLNFKDIMLATGKLAIDAFSTNESTVSECILGFEFAGVYQGKRVFGMGLSECLATHIDPSRVLLLDIPEDWTFEDAATVPIVYFTVYLALVLRGRMAPGESVLIHAGSGGVGQAAIQIALSMNCRVFTTVSSQKKRDFLKSRFPALTDESFSNSRDANDFEHRIHVQTQGRGVDLVLNCLAQEKLYASIRCLANGGRFLEVGKFDVFNDSSVGMSVLSKGISIFGILADLTFSDRTTKDFELVQKCLKDGIADRFVRPLPCHIFKNNQIEEAFRFMAQGKHIGKVVIQVKEDGENLMPIQAHPKTFFPPQKSYVIVGGLGGMGFELANWMIRRGARNVVLSSRSGITSTYHEYHLGMWRRRGVKAVLDTSDTTTTEGATSLLCSARELGAIGGIFNVAVVLKDAIFENQTSEDFELVAKCKAEATVHLDRVSRVLASELDYFVVFSSIVAARGNPGQTNYGFANSVMERICEQRHLEGLPALAVQWGAVGDVGVFHRTMKDKKGFGLAPQNIKSCLETLDRYLQQDKVIVSSFVPFQRQNVGTSDPNDTLVNIAANILGIRDIKKVNPQTPLVELGMDSLMVAELSQVIQSRLNVQLSPKELNQMNFEKLAELESKHASGERTGSGASSALLMNPVLTLKRVPDAAISQMNSLQKSKETVFFVHPIDGTVRLIEELVSHINSTAYGIQCVRDVPLESIETIAAYYLRKIKEIQPCGPYIICGYSFGVNVAFEMALQLEGQGETVGVLILLDGSPRGKEYSRDMKEDIVGQEWETRVISTYLQQYKSDFSMTIYKEVARLETLEDKIGYAVELLKETHPELTREEIKESAVNFVARLNCALAYEPMNKVKAQTFLVKASLTEVNGKIAHDYGLSDVCENLAEVIEIEGNHSCFYEKPVEFGISTILNKIIG